MRHAAPQKIVAESTYGAQPADAAGDLGVLYDLEQGLRALDLPVSILRGAYYLSNWDASLKTARDEGVVHTMFPGDFVMPMVAPEDLGHVAAKLMLEPAQRTGIHYVEGPARYSPDDVAAAFAKSLGRKVEAVATPRDRLQPAFEAMGFSKEGAASYAKMTRLTLDADFRTETEPVRGVVTLQAYVDALVKG